jgi:hypothetical protein
MSQIIDMKRLHMGCGESLCRPLPLPVINKRRLPARQQAVIGRNGAEATGKGKNVQDLDC